MADGNSSCRLELAVSNDSPVRSATDLNGGRVATAYPATTRDFFHRAGLGLMLRNSTR